jgi:tetratricopeptide (TPR) repeat protein
MRRLTCLCCLLSILASRAVRAQQSAEVQAEVREGLAALQRGEFGAAEQHLSAAVKIDPSQAEVRANLGIAYYADHKYPEAAAAFSETLKQNGSLTTAQAFLPLSLANANRCSEAIDGLKREFAANPDLKLRRILGLSLQRCLLQSDRQIDADQVMQQLLTQYPDDVDVLYEAGQMYAKLSSSLYLRLMQIAPHTARGFQLMAEVSASQNNWPGAIEAYRQALKLDPAAPNLRLPLAVLLLEHPSGPDDWKEALDLLNKEVELNPANGEAEYEIGEAQRKHDHPEEAIAAFRKAIRLDPNFVEPRLGLAKILRDRHQAQEALSVLEPARESAPQNAAMHFLLSQIYRDLGRAADADREQGIFRKLQSAEAPPLAP